MHSFTAVFLLLSMVSCRMVFAEVSSDVKLHYNVDDNGQDAGEDVELNQQENFVKVQIPATGGMDEMTLIHDFKQDLTLAKMNGNCFLLDGFDGFPENMQDWTDKNLVDGVTKAEGYKTYNYVPVPADFNSTELPSVMRDECDVINMTVLDHVTEGEAAHQEANEETDDLQKAVLYFPKVHERQLSRVKRWGFRRVVRAVTRTVRRTVRRVSDGARAAARATARGAAELGRVALRVLPLDRIVREAACKALENRWVREASRTAACTYICAHVSVAASICSPVCLVSFDIWRDISC